MMRNKLFCLLGALVLMGTSAFASPNIASLMSFKLPSYEQLKKLPPDAQREVIENIQAFLLKADEEARKDTVASHQIEVLKRLYDLWLETAEAKTKSRSRKDQQSYCINQGVVKPISECDTSLGYKMHDFDTNDVLSKLGPASQCPSGLKPCSPFFGFSSDGQMFCSSKNLTRDCAQQAKQPGTLSLANVMMSCEAGSPGAAKVDCQALKDFYDQQVSVVEQLCQKAPKRFACGILKDQMHEVFSEASEKKTAIGNVGLDKVVEAVKATNEVAQMSTSSVPCPPDENVKAKKAPAPAAKEAPAVAPKAKEVNPACAQKTLAKLPDEPTLDNLMAVLMGEKPQTFVCGALTLPNQGKVAMDRIKGALIIQATADSKPVVLDGVEAQILSTVSAALLEPPYKVPPKDLFSHYLPKEALKDPGKITLKSKDGKQQKDFPAKGWIASDGTRIRYVPNVDFGKNKDHVIMVAIQPLGGEKERVAGVQVQIPNAQEDDQGDEPSEAPNDANALSRQPK